MPPLSRADVEGAGILLTMVLSVIFYARRAFPADCFQVLLGSHLCDSKATHAALISSGTPLSSDEGTRDTILATGEKVVYMRKSDDARMTSFLETLDRIFEFLLHRRLGKIQFCFTQSKTWNLNSLLEFYSLKFSYTELGSVHMYLDWGGKSTSIIPGNDNRPLRAFLRDLPALEQPFYIHPFFYSIDSKSLGGKSGLGFGRAVKDAVAIFTSREGSEVGRLEKFIYYSPAEIVAQNAEEEAELHHKERVKKKQQSVLEAIKSLSFRQPVVKCQEAQSRPSPSFEGRYPDVSSKQTQSTVLCSTPPGYEMPSWMKGEDELSQLVISSPAATNNNQALLKSKSPEPQCSDWLIFNYEEDIEDMPPTQPPGDPTGLDSFQIHGHRYEPASSIQAPSSFSRAKTALQVQL